MRHARARLIQLGCLVLPVFGLACGNGERTEAAARLTGDLTRFDLVVENATSRALARADVWVDAPRAASADWRRAGIEVSRPYSLEPRSHGNERIRLAFEDVPVGFSERVSVRASLEPDGEDASHDDPAAYAAAVGGFDAAAVAQRARALAGAEAADTVDNVLAWVAAGKGTDALRAAPAAAHPPAEPIAVDDAALAEGGARGPDGKLLEQEEAPSRDDVWLAAALLRAAGVPARVVAGFADTGDGALRAERFELWIEVHREGRWHTRRVGEAAQGDGEAAQRERLVAMRIVAETDELSFGPVARSLAEGTGLRVSFQ